MSKQEKPNEQSTQAAKQAEAGAAKAAPAEKRLELAKPVQGGQAAEAPAAETKQPASAAEANQPASGSAVAKRAAPPPPVRTAGDPKPALQAAAPAAASDEVVAGPSLQVESVSGVGGGLRNLGLVLTLTGAGLAAGTFVSADVAGLVQKVGVLPGSLAAGGLALIGIGAVQRALGLDRMNMKQQFESLASANKRLRRDFQELRDVSASLGQNVDVLQEKTESLVQLTSGHGFQSSIFSLAASLDHLGITIKERCDALDRSVAAETARALEAQSQLSERIQACTGRVEGFESKLSQGQADVEAAVELVREANERAVAGLAERIGVASQQTGERLSAVEVLLAAELARVTEELGASVQGLSERVEGVQAEAARAASAGLAQQREALLELAVELERSRQSTEQAVRERLAELRSVLEQGLGTSDERLLRGLERQEGALSAGLAGITDDLAGRSVELAAAITAVRGVVEQALGRHELALAELSEEFVRTSQDADGGLASAVGSVVEEVRAGARAGQERHAQVLERFDAIQGQVEARHERLEAVALERTAEFAARVEGRVGEVVQRVGEVVGTRCEGLEQRVAGELGGIEERIFDGLDRRHGDLVGLAHELRDVVCERTGGLDELGQRVERALHERFDAVVHAHGELGQQTAEVREAVVGRVAELEAFVDARQDGLRGALEGALAGVVGAELARGQQASGKLGERLERELRGVEQRLGEDLERRQAMLSGELAGLSLEVQQAAREASAQLEQLLGAEDQGEDAGQHGLSRQVAEVVSRLGELERQLGRVDQRSGSGLEVLQAFREELAARGAQGEETTALEPVLDRLAERIERAIDRRADGLAEGISAELLTMAELSEERTLNLMGLLSGRSGAQQTGAAEPVSEARAEGEPAEDGFGQGIQADAAAQAAVPPALPGAHQPEAEWSERRPEGERWGESSSGW